MKVDANHRKWRAVLASTLAATLVAISVIGCEEEDVASREEPIRPVVSMVIGDVERLRTDTYPGRAKAIREVNTGFEVSGKVIERHVNVGDVVKEGDLLAVVEPDRYNAEVKRFEGEKAALDATLTNAVTHLKRQKYLLEKGHVSQARVDNAVMAVRAAKAKIRAVQAAIDGANVTLAYTQLKAPFAGTVSQVFVENFENVVAKQPVLRILDTSRIEMEVSVPESLIGLVPYVKQITVRFPSLPGVDVPAKIKEVSNEASVTTRTYPVTIVMEQPEGSEIRPGMAGEATAKVELPSDWTKKGIEVPVAAVFAPDKSAPEKAYVWIVDESSTTVAQRSVEIASLSERGLRIVGVEPGERIVTAGVSYLTEGQKVRISEQ